MKKIVLLCLFCVFLSGCSAEYYLIIDDQEQHIYDESGIISSFDIDSISSAYQSEWPTNAYITDEYFSESPERIPGVSYYEVQSYYDQQYHIKYSYSFPSDRFSFSSGVRSAFPNFTKNYNPNTNITTLDTGVFEANKFSNLEQLVIHVKVLNQVIDHNATSIDGNVYTWILNSNNFSTLRLLLRYEGGGTPITVEEEEMSQEDFFFPVLIVLFFFLIFLVLVFVYNYKQRNHS